MKTAIIFMFFFTSCVYVPGTETANMMYEHFKEDRAARTKEMNDIINKQKAYIIKLDSISRRF